MDWNFLTPLLGVGALGAAFINGTVALYKLKRDKADEHEKWMRDNKQEAYARFVSAVVEASLIRSPAEKAREAQQKAAAALSEVRLIGPPEVTEAAATLGRHSGKMFQLSTERDYLMPEFSANEVRIKQIGLEITSAVSKLPELTEAFVTVARRDIRTETVER